MTDLPTPDSLRPGHLVGPWRIEGYGGRGTYGVVYRARRAGHPGSLPVALKMALFPDDPRFRREVELMSRFHHPAVPRLIDRGWWHASAEVVHPYLVMEWIRGLPLYRWARVHSATQRQVLRVVAQVAWGLEVMHRSECLHRDVKGDNILVEPEGRALLTDFGSGTWAGAPPITDRIIAPGTPEYRSPDALRFLWEHWRDKGARYAAHPADDLYGLGVSLYKLVTGMYPPPGTDPEAHRSPQKEWYPPRLQPEARDVQVLPEFAALIDRTMARAPEARGQARELAEAAESVAEHAGAEADVSLFDPEHQAARAVSVPVQWEPREVVPELPASEAAGVPAPAFELRSENWPAPKSLEVPVQEEAWVSDSRSPEHSRSLFPGLAAAAAVLLAAAILWESRSPHEQAPELARAEAPDDGAAPDAGTRGLGDSTPTSRVTSEGSPVVVNAKVIAEEFPDEPLPGQLRAPCRGKTVEINEGCWHLLNSRPPCGEDAYEWKGACYFPVLTRGKPRTSKKPR